ncbi:SDR family NAD(P)-dependent oxidoreductase [Fulvimarina sp. MAC8]|uniref:SDR family NAD(P)-dependent oxidoreductase n=1 Tax=Fulvimarina sp. MAC8 TaxID=3162874 RepID=UPI0032EDBE40
MAAAGRGRGRGRCRPAAGGSRRKTVGLAPAGDALSLQICNVADPEAVFALPDEIMRHHHGVDGLITNAGIIQPIVTFSELEFDVIDRMLSVNLMGTVNMVKAFLPHLQARPSAHIINVASMGGFIPFPGQSMYGASKAEVKLLTEALHAELDASKNLPFLRVL